MLQTMDDILKVDLQTLRAELSQLAASLAGTFSAAVEKVTSHVISQVEQALVRSSDHGEEAEGLHESQQGKVLEHVLFLSHNVSNRLSRLESACLRRSEAEAQETAFQQDKLSPTREDNLILTSLWKELQQMRAELKASQKWAARHLLPAGKSTHVILSWRALWLACQRGHAINTDLHTGLQSNLMGSPEALSSLQIEGGNPVWVLEKKEALSFSKKGSKQGLIKVLAQGKAATQLGSHLLEALLDQSSCHRANIF